MRHGIPCCRLTLATMHFSQTSPDRSGEHVLRLEMPREDDLVRLQRIRQAVKPTIELLLELHHLTVRQPPRALSIAEGPRPGDLAKDYPQLRDRPHGVAKMRGIQRRAERVSQPYLAVPVWILVGVWQWCRRRITDQGLPEEIVALESCHTVNGWPGNPEGGGPSTLTPSS